jgi:hypothetical protein
MPLHQSHLLWTKSRTIPIVPTKSNHALNKKTRADIITMNAALTDVFLGTVSVRVCAAFQQRCLSEPKIVFVDMFEWFTKHYGTTTAEDCNANCQRMAADWHPSDSSDALALRFSTGAAYANATGTQWLMATSLTSRSGSSNDVVCTRRSTIVG